MKLASPSVTKWTLECPAGVSGMMPARIAAVRSCACCGPPHPLGCVNTSTTPFATDSHLSSPFGSVAMNNTFVDSKRYRMKSAKTSMIVLPFGSLVLIWSFISSDGLVGEIISFHLIYRHRLTEVNGQEPRTISSSGTHLHPGSPPRSRCRRSCRRGRNMILRELLQSRHSGCWGTCLLFVIADTR